MDRCNCITGDTDGVFFKDVGEAINHFVGHERRMNARYRKLFQLVEEEIKKPLDDGDYGEKGKFCSEYSCDELYGIRLQSLLDESKRNE